MEERDLVGERGFEVRAGRVAEVRRLERLAARSELDAPVLRRTDRERGGDRPSPLEVELRQGPEVGEIDVERVGAAVGVELQIDRSDRMWQGEPPAQERPLVALAVVRRRVVDRPGEAALPRDRLPGEGQLPCAHAVEAAAHEPRRPALVVRPDRRLQRRAPERRRRVEAVVEVARRLEVRARERTAPPIARQRPRRTGVGRLPLAVAQGALGEGLFRPPRDDVHHAAERARAVARAGVAPQDVDVVDELGRDGREIDRAARRTRQRDAIEQDQDLIRRGAAQFDRRELPEVAQPMDRGARRGREQLGDRALLAPVLRGVDLGREGRWVALVHGSARRIRGRDVDRGQPRVAVRGSRHPREEERHDEGCLAVAYHSRAPRPLHRRGEATGARPIRARQPSRRYPGSHGAERPLPGALRESAPAFPASREWRPMEALEPWLQWRDRAGVGPASLRDDRGFMYPMAPRVVNDCGSRST